MRELMIRSGVTDFGWVAVSRSSVSRGKLLKA
jgi:hypothetical protein